MGNKSAEKAKQPDNGGADRLPVGKFVNKSIKICLLGPASTGKTSLTRKWVTNEQLPPDIPATIGAAFMTKMIHFQDLELRVECWDTAGAERYRSLLLMYTRNAEILIFTATVESDPSQIREFIRSQIEQHRESDPSKPIVKQYMLVVNMMALKGLSQAEETQQASKEAQQLASFEEIAHKHDCFFLAMDIYKDDIQIFNSKLDEMLAKLLLH